MCYSHWFGFVHGFVSQKNSSTFHQKYFYKKEIKLCARESFMNHDHFTKVWIKCCELKYRRNTHIYTQKSGLCKTWSWLENMIVTRLLLLLLLWFISIQFNSLFLHFTFDPSHLLDSLTSEPHLNRVNSFLFSAEIWFLVEKKQCSQFIPVTWNIRCTCLRLSEVLNGCI